MLHELIDTLWNVNSKNTESRLPKSLELIDTLWNVNLCGKKLALRKEWN